MDNFKATVESSVILKTDTPVRRIIISVKDYVREVVVPESSVETHSAMVMEESIWALAQAIVDQFRPSIEKQWKELDEEKSDE